MSLTSSIRLNDQPAGIEIPALTNCVIGVDVGGSNTDCVVLQGENVLFTHKTATTLDIQRGVEDCIDAVIAKSGISSDQITSVKIGTTQFVNAVLEQDSSKLDKVAVIRLCGPYSQSSPPFVEFTPKLRELVEGHVGYVDGGYQIDGAVILPINHAQLKDQAKIIKSKSIKSVVVIGIYSPSNRSQEEEAQKVLAAELGDEHHISCSHAIGKLGFLERENASILNASLRRFARNVIAGFTSAIRKLGKCKLYITLNDGTLSKASTAAQYPIRCFSSGPTNSARGAALLAKLETTNSSDDREVVVVDVGGTTTDIAVLLKSGFPRQSAAFVKIAGVRTNFTIPDVHSIALGGGSIVRTASGRASVGPDSVGSRLDQEGIYFGGQTMTATDLALNNKRTQELVSPAVKDSGRREIMRALEAGIDFVKTKPGDVRLILVGGGSIIIDEQIAGVGELIRPKYYEVANAIGAAMGKICGTVDKTVVHGARTINEEIEDARTLAIERCVTAGGNRQTIEVIEIDVIPVSYVTNGATRIAVRVVGDLTEGDEEDDDPQDFDTSQALSRMSQDISNISKGSSYDIAKHIDLESYRPKIEGDLWYLSELDLQFLVDGTGVLGVGSCGEPYPAYLACLLALKSGKDITIRRQDTFPDSGIVVVGGFMGSPTVYLERIPGLNEVMEAIRGVMNMTELSSFDAVIPNEIGGFNSFEALLAAQRSNKSTLDTDLVARAYPMLWQTVRCLEYVPISPAAISDGANPPYLFRKTRDNDEAEILMRDACTKIGSLAGMSINPITGAEAKTLPKNSYSHAWMIGRSIAISRVLKQDPVISLLTSENGVLLFTGKIISVTRNVASGFTRGNVLLESSPDFQPPSSLFVEFENENLSATLRGEGKEDRLLAVCPDLITFLDKANGAPLGISDYKYGLGVSVIALRAPPVWTTKKGLEMGGPRAFGLNTDFVSVGEGEYEAPKSVWDLFGDE